MFFAWTSWTSFGFPRQFAESLGFRLTGPDGLNEIRAQYGGFFFALAVVNALALIGFISRRTCFALNTVVFGGLLIGRLASLPLDGGLSEYGSAIRVTFFIDATGLGLAIPAYFRERFYKQMNVTITP
jgi:hypothetical protein